MQEAYHIQKSNIHRWKAHPIFECPSGVDFLFPPLFVKYSHSKETIPQKLGTPHP
uniref:Uncharacterized protein n=1 Tax=Romanomermis culicivorax TaxID=13658 RepID=A0A915IS10_ROMCU